MALHRLPDCCILNELSGVSAECTLLSALLYPPVSVVELSNTQASCGVKN